MKKKSIMAFVVWLRFNIWVGNRFGKYFSRFLHVSVLDLSRFLCMTFLLLLPELEKQRPIFSPCMKKKRCLFCVLVRLFGLSCLWL